MLKSIARLAIMVGVPRGNPGAKKTSKSKTNRKILHNIIEKKPIT